MTEIEREPDETELPDKPPVEDMPGEEGDQPPADEADVTTFMRPQDAQDDPTVDDTESDTD